jgi:ribosomal protein S18 acetylase RimI-like enzyme
MGFELVVVRSETDWNDYHMIRRSVLWEARGRTGYNERHGNEYHSHNYPLLLKADGCSVGTVRLDNFGNGSGAIRLVAIEGQQQKSGLGRIMTDLLAAYAKTLGITVLYVAPAPEAIGFYQKTGWLPYIWNKSEFDDIYPDCTQLRKLLA